jgi:hypothetical protein
MNLQNIVITQLLTNPSDYNIKADIYNDSGQKIGDFGVDGTDMFAWWVQQDSDFQLNIVNQFKFNMAQEIVAGTAE